MNKKIKLRNPGIELARILGCLIVIGVHVSLADTVNGLYIPSRGLINCFLADGVAIFWLITGCFLFRTTSYKIILQRTAKTIALPLAIYSIFCLFFSDYIANGGPLIQCTYNSFAEYLQGFKDAISLNQTIPFSTHLWYCYTYILVMIAFPVLKAFVQWLEEDYKREINFCLISFALFIINDFTGNQSFTFSHHGLNAAVPAGIIIILGTILYRNKERLLKYKYIRLFAAICFITLNMFRMLIVLKTGNRLVLFWFSSFGLMCSIYVVIFALSVTATWKNKRALPLFTLWIAKHTFFIYMVHVPVIALLNRYNVPATFLSILLQYTDGILLEVLYSCGMILIVFSLSLAISIIFSLPFLLFKRITTFRDVNTDIS